MTTVQRLEALGERGEACIILKDDAPATPEGETPTPPRFTLATGERLTYSEADGTFRTLDGHRTFRLRG